MATVPSAPQDMKLRQTLQQLHQLTYEMAQALYAQRELVAQRDIDLPLEPLQALEHLSHELYVLSQSASDSSLELQRLRQLARTAQIINSRLSLDQVLNEVIDTVVALTGAERGFIVLKEQASGQFVIKVARKFDQGDFETEAMRVSRTILEQVIQSGESVLTTNAQDDPRFADVESVFDLRLRSLLCVPLKLKGQVIGAIYVDNRVLEVVFTPQDERLVSVFANQAAIAIENARLFDSVRAALAEVTAIRDFMDNVFDSIASGVITADQNDVVMLINQAAARILDIERYYAQGKSLWAVLPTLYEGFQQLVAEVRRRNIEQTIEVEPVLARRGQVSLTLRLSPFRDQTQTTKGVAIVLDDLTTLKQQQATLSAVRRYLPTADNLQAIDMLELGGVEREISILFCDIRGFTAFSEQLSPEALMLTINQYLTVSSGAIEAFGGIVDKFMGDAAVGLFNTQFNPMDNHALKAVRAALKLLEDVHALHRTLPRDHCLEYGIGVHTGLAVLGNVGSPRRKEFTAIGETVQLAKYLQELAPGGEVIISEATYMQVAPYVQVEPAKLRRALEPHESPPRLFRVLAVTA
ncbi:MAG: adenylate/guanylate cyclase domain-containing protein [Anaerolineae bacterium]|nr:GAF domain-containing protein [Anaerolineae bacterium]MDW8298101.1 adenylate/guanylate cyclase domain-containing protein [Anaerolineae bacterium]